MYCSYSSPLSASATLKIESEIKSKFRFSIWLPYNIIPVYNKLARPWYPKNSGRSGELGREQVGLAHTCQALCDALSGNWNIFQGSACRWLHSHGSFTTSSSWSTVTDNDGFTIGLVHCTGDLGLSFFLPLKPRSHNEPFRTIADKKYFTLRLYNSSRIVFSNIAIVFGSARNSAINSTGPENPTLEPNMEWIG